MRQVDTDPGKQTFTRPPDIEWSEGWSWRGGLEPGGAGESEVMLGVGWDGLGWVGCDWM